MNDRKSAYDVALEKLSGKMVGSEGLAARQTTLEGYGDFIEIDVGGVPVVRFHKNGRVSFPVAGSSR